MSFFVTAIDTDSGKTAISAILAKALGYAYWKPIQAGEPTDTEEVVRLVPEIVTYSERHKLALPMSPHAAARAEGIEISLSDFQIPRSENLVIEGIVKDIQTKFSI